MGELIHNDKSKFKEAILYIVDNFPNKNLNKTKLYKVLFLADFAYFKQYGKSITNTFYLHHRHGPVPEIGENILNEMNDQDLEISRILDDSFIEYRFKNLRNPDKQMFEENELNFINRYMKFCGDKTAIKLSEVTHKMDLYKLTKQGERIPYALVFYDVEDDLIDDEELDEIEKEILFSDEMLTDIRKFTSEQQI